MVTSVIFQHFVSERKLDEELCGTQRLACDRKEMEQVIGAFGSVVQPKTSYSLHQYHYQQTTAAAKPVANDRTSGGNKSTTASSSTQASAGTLICNRCFPNLLRHLVANIGTK